MIYSSFYNTRSLICRIRTTHCLNSLVHAPYTTAKQTISNVNRKPTSTGASQQEKQNNPQKQQRFQHHKNGNNNQKHRGDNKNGSSPHQQSPRFYNNKSKGPNSLNSKNKYPPNNSSHTNKNNSGFEQKHQSSQQQPNSQQKKDEKTTPAPKQSNNSSTRDKTANGSSQNQTSAPPSSSKDVHIIEGMTISTLATALGIRHRELASQMTHLGFDETQGDMVLNAETAALIAMEYGFHPILPTDTLDDLFDVTPREDPTPEEYAKFPVRPPVVTIMGHVDHGKTTLLDSLRKTSVAAGEAGGITQHIGAFSVSIKSHTNERNPDLTASHKITFIDTPGHAAFSGMRQRGAQTTDIVILVVAGDDGIMPQTKEAIRHAQSCPHVKMIVAINKCDKPGVDLEKIKGDLAKLDVVVEDYGGDVPCVPISALTGQGLDTLIETINILAEVMDLRGDTSGPSEGVVLESQLSRGKGGICTILVKRGTLKEGSILICGETFSKVRRMTDEKGNVVREAGPSTPVEVIGWKEIPKSGDMVLECANEETARKAIASRKQKAQLTTISSETIDLLNKTKRLGKVVKESNKAIGKMIRAAFEKNERLPDQRKVSMMLMKEMNQRNGDNTMDADLGGQEDKKKYPVVVKADVHGSLEALEGTLSSLPSHEVSVQLLSTGVGPVGESDVDLAFLAKGKVLSFNLPVSKKIELYAKQKNVEIVSENIIYRIMDRVTEDLISLLPTIEELQVHGEAIVQEVFPISVKKKKENIAGCKVLNGFARLNYQVKVSRGSDVIYDGKLKSLRHHKEEVQEIPKGKECGMAFDGFDGIQKDDRIQFYSVVPKRRTHL